MGFNFWRIGKGESNGAKWYKSGRAVVFYDGPDEIIRLSRQHNNANILSFGSRFIESSRAIELIKMWLNTNFEGGRHQQRIQKLESY